MPYIKQEFRRRLENILISMIIYLRKESIEDRDGIMNYTISTLMSHMYKVNYKDINAAVGVLECVKLEMYRRVAAPYEDTKIIENGDVYKQ